MSPKFKLGNNLGKKLFRKFEILIFTTLFEPEFTKLLVGGGWSPGGVDARMIEVIDLKSPNTTCKTNPNFPTHLDSPSGGLGFQNKPMICGGLNGTTATTNCFSLDGNAWTPSASLNEPRYASAFAAFPSQNQSRKLIIASGYATGYQKTSEVLTENGWEMFSKTLPGDLWANCLVLLNSTTLMIIGDRATYYINTLTNAWVRGPLLTQGRGSHSCGLIRKDSNSQEMSVIVAGGYNYTALISTTELLDAGSNTWRRGPELPFTVIESMMVEGPDGGAVIVGGRQDGWFSTSPFIYQLPHGGSGAV